MVWCDWRAVEFFVATHEKDLVVDVEPILLVLQKQPVSSPRDFDFVVWFGFAVVRGISYFVVWVHVGSSSVSMVSSTIFIFVRMCDAVEKRKEKSYLVRQGFCLWKALGDIPVVECHFVCGGNVKFGGDGEN